MTGHVYNRTHTNANRESNKMKKLIANRMENMSSEECEVEAKQHATSLLEDVLYELQKSNNHSPAITACAFELVERKGFGTKQPFYS